MASESTHPLHKWRHCFDPPKTQDEVAKAIKHDRSTVIAVEKCQQQPRKRFIEAIQKYTGGKVTGKDLISYWLED